MTDEKIANAQLLAVIRVPEEDRVSGRQTRAASSLGSRGEAKREFLLPSF